MLGHCDQRSKELGKGAIVAVGDPAYRTFHGLPTHLKASGEEVNFIEELFGKEYVVKLVGKTATPSEVLKCAKYPSEVLKKKKHPPKRGVKQAISHLSVHSGRDEKSATELARSDAEDYPLDSPCPKTYGNLPQIHFYLKAWYAYTFS